MKLLETCMSVFELPYGDKQAVCVTTNGVIKTDGSAVMGAGVAKECARLYPMVPILLGRKLVEGGNKVYDFGEMVHIDAVNIEHRFRLFTFPTKQHWRENSRIDLIYKSCTEMIQFADKLNLATVYLPMPGCANGHLSWENDVRPTIEPLLDDRFVVLDRRSS